LPTLDDVSSIAATLPGNVTKVTPYGSTWLVRNKAYAWESHPWPSEAEHIRELVSRELCIGVKLPDDDTKRALVQGWPDSFAVSETPWGGPKVIVRMERIDEQLLRELVIDAWRTEAPKYLVREYDERQHDEREGSDGDVG
jgi:hypothetical protein